MQKYEHVFQQCVENLDFQDVYLYSREYVLCETCSFCVLFLL